MLHSCYWWSWVVLAHQYHVGQIWELIGERSQNSSGLVFFLFWFFFLKFLGFLLFPLPMLKTKKQKKKHLSKKLPPSRNKPRGHTCFWCSSLCGFVSQYPNVFERCSAHSHPIVLILTFEDSSTLAKTILTS